MTIMESAIAMNNDYVECSNTLGKIGLFAEAAYKEYEINLKEAALKVLKENGTEEDFNFLATEAANGYAERAKKTIEKIVESIKKFIEKCKENFNNLIDGVKTKNAINKVEEICKISPKVRSAKIKYSNTDKQVGILQQGIDAVRKKVSKVKAKGKATEADVDEVKKIEADTMKKIAAVSIVTTVTIGAAIALLTHCRQQIDSINIKNTDIIDFSPDQWSECDAETAHFCTTSAGALSVLTEKKVSFETGKFANILNSIKSGIGQITGKVLSKDLEGQAHESVNIEDLAMFEYMKESVDESDNEEQVEDQPEVVEESSNTEGLDLDAYFDEVCDSIFSNVTESAEDTEEVAEVIDTPAEEEPTEEETVEEGATNEEAATDTEDTFAESYMNNLEQELFGEENVEEMTTESYLDSLEQELFGNEDTEEVATESSSDDSEQELPDEDNTEEVATESTFESLLDEMENILL